MKDTADVRLCVIDHGIYFPVAQRLAKSVKKVFYHIPNGDAFESFSKGVLGDGHRDVELLNDFWMRKTEIDGFVFPDVGDGGLQLELQSQGFPVWGSKCADREEKFRGQWLKTCERLSLPMPQTERIQGLTNLRLFLKEHEGEKWFVKISRWRGDMETWGTTTPAAVNNKLDGLALKFGPFQERIPFYVQKEIKTEIEAGSDTYRVNGQWPDKIVLGYEKKGESYLATWKTVEEMPEQVWRVNEAIEPLLDSYGYCNMVSSEVRITGDESFFLDPCFRFPSPAGEEQLELYENFGDIVWRGANGEMVNPEMAAKFCGEAVISYNGDRDGWKSVSVPKEVEQWVKLYACGYEDGAYHFPPQQDPEAIGCVVGLGDDASEVIGMLKEIQEAMKDEPVTIRVEPIADLIQEIDEAQEQGIPFTKKPLPEPAEVLE